jgi:UDP-N-acetylglucosamine acyltransferase
MPRIHPTAQVDPAAELADDVTVGPYCVIGPRVVIGSGTVLESHAIVIGNTRMGRNNRLSPHAVIGGPPQLLKDLGRDVGLVIGDRNTFREFVTVNTGTELGGGPTRIGNDCLFMACSHVAHDCVLADHVELVNNALLAGHIHVGDRAIVSGGAAMHHWVTVGTLSFVGGLSRIIQDVPPYMIVEGNPSKVRGVNMVGLRRGGSSEETIQTLKRAHRLVYRSQLTRKEALDQLELDEVIPEIRCLAEFVRRSIAGKQGRARQP